MRVFIASILLALGACTQFPELDDRLSETARRSDYPALVPLEPLLAARSAPADRGPDITGSLQSRVASLNARASRLRRNVLSNAERARLRDQPSL